MSVLIGRKPLSLAISLSIPLLGGFISGLATQPNIKPWYEKLKKPFWNPPKRAFGPVWTFLYAAMGYASFRVYDVISDNPSIDPTIPLSLYAVQLGLNFAWSPVFFGLRSPGAALPIIFGLLGSVTATTIEFFKIDEIAGYLMVPYIAWLTYASTLNVYIWLYNPSKSDSKKA
ncbi:hypothetical protein SeLEV6574_g07139 [Synchytrium endobioticum]|nr:hypothetical protein SeLEV6574_g08186 [Synchytrium endobioticum]TPX39530.1 hypothetical protein SeLEV6574_g07139 [Synchytrium endobioticum]